MTDVFRPYFRDSNYKNSSKVAIYMFSAVLRENVRRETEYSRFSHAVHFSGWEDGPHRRDRLKCCHLLDDRQVSEGTDTERIYPTFGTQETHFASVHYKCTLNEPERLIGSYVVPKSINCADFQQRAIKPHVLLPAKNGSIGVCLKILYGNVDIKLLVDWMEYYKEMKVDTIITKTYHVSPVVQRILTNYVNDGLLEVLPFEIPWTPIGQSNIYPSKNGFLFKSEMFIKDWGAANSNNGSDIVRYFQRLAPELNRPKFVAITSSIADGRVRTHAFNMGLNDRPFRVSSNVAAIKHYRLCYFNQVCNGTRYNDTSILTVVRRFEDRSARILNRLGTP